MKNKPLLIFILLIVLSCSKGLKTEKEQINSLEIFDITCEYLLNPKGIETPAPRLGWKLKSAINGEQQTAYKVIVSDCEKSINKAIGNIWDSGKVESANSNNIKYEGADLLPAKQYFWKVKVWNESGKEQKWSETQKFETGLFSEKDWQQAKWIGLEKDTRTSQLKSRPVQTRHMDKPRLETSYPSPLFRKEFSIKNEIKSARFYISGLGYNELYLNGKKVGDAVLNPGQTSYDKRAFYDVFDVTSFLNKGNNVVGVMLGNGFYGQNMAFGVKFLNYGAPALKALLRIDYENGDSEYIKTNESWLATCGPIIFDNVYAGETYDARHEIENWSNANCEYVSWQDAVIRNDVEIPRLTAQLLQPIKKIKYLPAKSFFKSKTGKYIFDVGQNISGWAIIKVNEPTGTQITIRYSEILSKDKQELETVTTGVPATGFEQTEIYICKGGTEEIWEPRFTYHGFRYMEVEGISNPSINSVEACFVRSAVERTGTFECSDTLLNRIYSTSLWTIEDNLHSIPEDCPHREKCAWLGDAHTSVEVMSFNYDMRRFWIKFMNDVQTNLGKGGVTYEQIPATAGIPTNIAVGKRVCQEARPDWGAAIIIVPWQNYLFYGNEQILEDNYPHMVRWMAYLKGFLKEDILYQGYGDWCHPNWGGREEVKTNVALTSTAYYYYSLKLMSKIARLLNRPVEAKRFMNEMPRIKAAFNNAFFDAKLNTYGTQTGNAVALNMELVSEGMEADVAKSLAELELTENIGGHFFTGIHGAKRMFTELSEFGYEDELFSMLKKEDFPSFLYLFNHGFTTWPEAILNYSIDGNWKGSSHNHPMQAGFAMWFHQNVGGIQLDESYPGFKHFTIKPFGFNHLEFANAGYQSVYGFISSEWKVSKSLFTHSVTIPVNTSATVFVPSINFENVEIKQIQKGRKENIEFLGIEDSFMKYKLKSGKYQVKSLLN